MKRKNVATFSAAVSICFFLNIYIHHNIVFALLNAILLGLSLLIVFLYSNKFTGILPVFIVATSLIPLFYFIPNNPIVYNFTYAYLILWVSSIKFTKIKSLLVIIGFVLLLWGTLISNNLITFPISVNRERLIFKNRVVQEKISYHQKDARYVPYRMRRILFNNSVYVYSSISNVAFFLSFQNLYNILLIANIYPLIIGIIFSWRNKKQYFNGVILLALALTFFALGINSSADKFNSLFIATPLLLYLIIQGLQKVNKKIYALLLIISLILISYPT